MGDSALRGRIPAAAVTPSRVGSAWGAPAGGEAGGEVKGGRGFARNSSNLLGFVRVNGKPLGGYRPVLYCRSKTSAWPL